MKKVVTAHIVQRYTEGAMPSGGFTVDLSSFDRPGSCFARATMVLLEFGTDQVDVAPIFKLAIANNSASSDSVLMYKDTTDAIPSALGYTPIASVQVATGSSGPSSSFLYFSDSNSTPIVELDFKSIASAVRFVVLGQTAQEVTANLMSVYADIEFTFEE
jgi:hypothetical protein